MFPILHLGPAAIQTPGLFILAGVWIGLSLAERHATIYGVSPAKIYNLGWISLLVGILGARLAYVLENPSAFQASPLSIVSLNPQLADIWGGGATACLAAVIYQQRNKLPFWSTLDALTSLFGVLAVAIGFAHLASGSAFGMPAQLPWSINLWGAARHPSQVYEILATLITFGFTWPWKSNRFGRWFSNPTIPGLRFFAFIALSAGFRLFLEAFRGDSSLLFGTLRSAQVIAWVILSVSLIGIRSRLRPLVIESGGEQDA